MKISARNKLKGKIVEVKKGTTTAHVRVGQSVTAVCGWAQAFTPVKPPVPSSKRATWWSAWIDYTSRWIGRYRYNHPAWSGNLGWRRLWKVCLVHRAWHI